MSVERIVLGQNATGPCELPQLERVDPACRHARREQGSHRPAFVQAACDTGAAAGEAIRGAMCRRAGTSGSLASLPQGLIPVPRNPRSPKTREAGRALEPSIASVRVIWLTDLHGECAYALNRST
jgi:hypothetical protein